MTRRIAWVSPFTPATGVGTFSKAVTDAWPATHDGEGQELTLFHSRHPRLYPTRHRAIPLEGCDPRVFALFDLVVFNIGNNGAHHGAIFDLMAVQPGVAICHDHVYQHVLAERSARAGGFGGYAALVMRYGSRGTGDAGAFLARSRITRRDGAPRYSPWDSEDSVLQPLGRPLADLASALVVHSAFAEAQFRDGFAGPILRLGMPHDLKPSAPDAGRGTGGRGLHLVSFGWIQQAKCLDRVIAALAGSDLLRRRVRYTVAGHAGDGAHLAMLRDLVARHSLADIVVFEPDVSDARLARLAGEADAFVNLRDPNTEGASASLSEQMARGTPVVVMASGCYAEIPQGAAVILPAGASAAAIGAALEDMVRQPERLAAIGRAGRHHARRWSAASYAGALLRFASHHRPLLEARGRAVGRTPRPPSREPGQAVWLHNLALARLSLRALDRGTLVVDPALLAAFDDARLCRYLAEVVLGVFDRPALDAALRRLVAGRRGMERYLACVRLHLIAEAASTDAGAAEARERLAAAGPVADPAVWSVIEAMPPRLAVTAATLLLAGRPPTAEELAGTEGDEGAAPLPLRLRLRALLHAAAQEAGFAPLRPWLDEPCLPDLPLPVLDEAVDWGVGDDGFAGGAALSGFHAVEPDHVWARGTAAFLALRLGAAVTRVEVLVRHVDAGPARPCTITLAAGAAEASVEATAPDPLWIGLDLPRAPARADAVTWFRLGAARAVRPPGSADTRVLGAALIRVRLSARAALRPARDAAPGRPRLSA